MENFNYTIVKDEDPRPSEAKQKFQRLVWFISGSAKTPTLSRSKERELILAAQEGVRDAADELTRRHSSFLDKIARTVASTTGTPELHEDLFGEALESFHKSILSFNLEKFENGLASYARYNVVGDLKFYVRYNKGPLTHTKSYYQRKAFYQHRKLKQDFWGAYGREFDGTARDYADLEKLTGIPARAAKFGFEAWNIRAVPLQRVEIADPGPSIEDMSQRASSSQALSQAFVAVCKTLIPRDFDIFSTLSQEEVSAADMAEKYNITPERVRQIYRGSASRLRTELAAHGITSRSDLQ